MTTPQVEAKVLIRELTTQVTEPGHDLRMIMRKCYMLCNLLGWSEQASWFDRELNGYGPEDELPTYRIVPGLKEWEAEAIHDRIRSVSAAYVGARTFDKEPESVSFEAGGALESIFAASQKGYARRTGETREGFDSQEVHLIRVERYDSARFAAIQQELERLTFKFIADSYKTIVFGEASTGLWDRLRSKVETKLMEMGLAGHLDAITPGLETDNAEVRRSAAFACRTLIDDLASYLWQDSRPEYEHLPGQDGRRLSVTADKSLNRLGAYLHQKGTTGTPGSFVRAEIDRLHTSFSKLYNMQSMSHNEMSEEDMASVGFATFALIGELVNRTDMEPISEYNQPGVSDG